MKIVFISNYINHHQLPFSKAMLDIPNVEYNFIATVPTPEFRLNLGYADMNDIHDFVITTYKSEENYNKALNLCAEADVAIFGSAPHIFIKQRLKQKKLTFKFSERIYKIKPPLYQMPLRALKYFWVNSRHENLYLLCSSAYTSADYAKTFTFINKAFKWGYFPEVKKYDDIDRIIKEKTPNSILWAGRLIEWKHPEKAVLVAKRLKDEGYNFEFNIIGSGDKEAELYRMCCQNDLSDCVHFLGNMSPEEVREYMEKSKIFLFTSDRQEGWGAVLNESMNSGCAVIASEDIGAAPFLIKNGENGLMYQDQNFDDLYNKVKYLLDNPEKAESFGKEAYKTLREEWNAENAANRFVRLAKEMLKGNKKPFIFEDGVCSKAEIINEKLLER